MTDHRRPCLLIASLLIAVPWAALAQGESASPETTSEAASSELPPPGPSHDQAAIELLEQMAAAHADLETLAGEFTQIKHSELFLEEIASRGHFQCRRPDLFRYDYEASETTGPSSYFFDGETISAYIPDLRQLEVYREPTIGGSFRGVLIGLDEAVDDLQAQHWIHLIPASPEADSLAEGVVGIRFEPREEGGARDFVSADLWVDPVTLLPARVKMVEESGDETTLTFSSLEMNPVLDDAVFDPLASIPPETEIIEHP